MEEVKKVVLIGGGHCNCQVLKLLKKLIVEPGEDQPKITLTIVSDGPRSYYSGMLPGTVAQLYTDDDIMVHLGPVAEWCKADFIDQAVTKIEANANKVHLKDGRVLEYDALAVNVGSKTKAAGQVPGVWEHALTTRPINDLLPKIVRKETELKEAGIIPSVVVCGAGAAGTELSFAFKARWGKVFGEDIKVTLIGSDPDLAAPDQNVAARLQIDRKLKEKGIKYMGGHHIKEVKAGGVVLEDGTEVECTVPVWATGAEPQGVTAESDLEMLKGYFRVNKFLQSTSHPNVFAGGDCIEMEDYVDKPYPTKAGVYAVREGPYIAQNLVNYLSNKPLQEYVPQTGFLALMMTGDGSCIGAKFGISFVGKWVWRLKDWIDFSFMDLFNPKYLFKDYETQGTAEPVANFTLFDDEADKTKALMEELKAQVKEMDPAEAGKILSCGEDEEDFHLRWQILTRMHFEEEWRNQVVAHFNPAYKL